MDTVAAAPPGPAIEAARVGAEQRALAWARGIARASLPSGVRALAWAPVPALIAVAVFGAAAWAVVLPVLAVTTTWYVLAAAAAATRASVLVPALAEVEAFAEDGDRVILAVALPRLLRTGRTRVDQGAPAAALANTVALVLAEAAEFSCVEGHVVGCAHRCDKAAWATWLARHTRHPADAANTVQEPGPAAG